VPRCSEGIPFVQQQIITAQHALNHAHGQCLNVGRVLAPACGIADGAYFIQVGFNKQMIRRGTGALQEINLYVNFNIPGDVDSVLNELGKLLSPFPSKLFTPDVLHPIPFVSTEGKILEEAKVWVLLRNHKIFQQALTGDASLTHPPAIQKEQIQDSKPSDNIDKVEPGAASGDSNVCSDKSGSGANEGEGTEGGGSGSGAGGNDDSSQEEAGHGGREERDDKFQGGGRPPTDGESTGGGGGDPGAGPGGSVTTDPQRGFGELCIPINAQCQVEWNGETRVSQSFTYTCNINVIVRNTPSHSAIND
jgi:hypothetical protein